MLAPHRRVIAPIPEQPPPPVPYPNDVAQGPAPAESDGTHTLPLPEPADKEEDETTVTFSKERAAMEPLRNYVKDYAVFGKQKRLEYHLRNVKPHPDTPTEAGTTLLHEALVHGHDDVARLLLSHGADPDCGHYRTGVTPLHDCARENLASGIRILLTADADIDPATKNGTTPLMRAAVGGHCDVIRLLLREGADLALVDNAGDDAEVLARRYGKTEAADIIAERRRLLKAGKEARIREAVERARAAVAEAKRADAEAAAAAAAEVAHELRGHANGRRRQRRAAQQPLARPEGRQQRQGRPGRRERQHGPGQRDGERDFPDAPQRRELDVETALEHEQREADGADERERLVVGDGVQALRAQHHAGDDLADERRRRQPARDGAEEPGREHEEDDGERPQERVGHRCDAGGRRRSTMRARTGALRLPAVHHSRVHVNGQTRVQPCASLTFWLGSTQWIYTMALASP